MIKKLWNWIATNLAIRLAPRVAILLTSQNRNKIEAVQREAGAEIHSPIKIDRRFQLINFLDEGGRSITVVGSAEPSIYEQEIQRGNLWGTADVVWLIRELLFEKGLLIDVGANIGCVAFPIAGDGHNVVAVEMIPENCLKLHIGKIANKFHEIEILQAAASSNDCLLQYGGQDAWGVVGHGDKTALALRLDTIWLSSALIYNFKKSDPVVIKIDVEGHELEAIRGGARLIEHFRPCVIFESIHTANVNAIECKNLFADWGYKLYFQHGNIMVPRLSSDFQESLVSDFLAIPAERSDIMEKLTVRPLTADEKYGIISRDAAGSAPHRDHALVVIELFKAEYPHYPSTL